MPNSVRPIPILKLRRVYWTVDFKTLSGFEKYWSLERFGLNHIIWMRFRKRKKTIWVGVFLKFQSTQDHLILNFRVLCKVQLFKNVTFSNRVKTLMQFHYFVFFPSFEKNRVCFPRKFKPFDHLFIRLVPVCLLLLLIHSLQRFEQRTIDDIQKISRAY